MNLQEHLLFQSDFAQDPPETWFKAGTLDTWLLTIADVLRASITAAAESAGVDT